MKYQNLVEQMYQYGDVSWTIKNHVFHMKSENDDLVNLYINNRLIFDIKLDGSTDEVVYIGRILKIIETQKYLLDVIDMVEYISKEVNSPFGTTHIEYDIKTLAIFEDSGLSVMILKIFNDFNEVEFMLADEIISFKENKKLAFNIKNVQDLYKTLLPML